MTAVQAYAEANHVLSRYNLNGAVLKAVMDALMAGTCTELFTDTRLRVKVQGGQVSISPVDPRSHESFSATVEDLVN